MFFLITGLHFLVLVSTFCFLPADFIARRQVAVREKEVADNEEVGVELIGRNGGSTSERIQLVSILVKDLPQIDWFCFEVS